MDAPITTQTFLDFVAYFGTGLAVLAISSVLVALRTAHREFRLIRVGDTAAAIQFAGTFIGLALPLHAAITPSVSLLDALIWGVASAIAQILAYLLTRLVSPRLSQQITDNVPAAGIFAAGAAIGIGLINAAAMTP